MMAFNGIVLGFFAFLIGGWMLVLAVCAAIMIYELIT